SSCGYRIAAARAWEGLPWLREGYRLPRMSPAEPGNGPPWANASADTSPVLSRAVAPGSPSPAGSWTSIARTPGCGPSASATPAPPASSTSGAEPTASATFQTPNNDRISLHRRPERAQRKLPGRPNPSQLDSGDGRWSVRALSFSGG